MDGYLIHYGIKGQQWGIRNGPPYPLGESAKSASERKTRSHFQFTKKQKMLIKIGAYAALTGLSIYGATKIDPIISSKIYKSNLNAKSIDFGNLGPEIVDKATGRVLTEEEIESKINFKDAVKESVTAGVRKQITPESFKESLSKANPYLGKPEGVNICNQSALAGFLRACNEHYDVTAKPNGGKMLNLGGMLEEVFPKVKVLDGSAGVFGKSMNDAKSMLVRRYGDNAEGVVGIQWKNAGYGHTFNWAIKNGEVSFIDYSRASEDVIRYWSQIDPNGTLTLARLDGLVPNEEALKKYCE